MIRTCYKCKKDFEAGTYKRSKYMCSTCYEDFQAKFQEWIDDVITPILGDPNLVPELVEKFKIPENKEN